MGFSFKIFMSTIRRIQDFRHSFSFSSPVEHLSMFRNRFLESDFGKIYLAVPWDSLVKTIGAGEAKKGPRPLFAPKEKIALMRLKHYADCCDRKLMEGLNGNFDWQFFCDIYFVTDRLENYKILSEIRCELAGRPTSTGYNWTFSPVGRRI